MPFNALLHLGYCKSLGLVIFGWIAQLFSVALQVSVDASGFVFGPLADIVKMNESLVKGLYSHSWLYQAFCSFRPYLHFFVLLRHFTDGCKGDGMGNDSGHASIWSGEFSGSGQCLVGQTEAPLIVKPYVSGMSRSELLALMVGSMATIAGSVFAIYMAMLGGGDERGSSYFLWPISSLCIRHECPRCIAHCEDLGSGI